MEKSKDISIMQINRKEYFLLKPRFFWLIIGMLFLPFVCLTLSIFFIF